MDSNKRLFRSDDAMIGGVCAGIAEYFDIDPTIVRIIAVVLIVLGVGAPVIAYLIAWFIMPRRPKGYVSYIDVKPAGEGGRTPFVTPPPPSTSTPPNPSPPPNPPTPSSPTTSASAASSPTPDPTTVPDPDPAFAPPPPPSPPPPAAAQGTGGCAASPGSGYTASPGSGYTASPGSGYTASNSEAFDAVDPALDPNAPAPTKDANRRRTIRGAVIFGLLLVALGVIALLGTLVDISLWRLWPLILIIAGIIVLFTPGRRGWKIERAGHGILLVTAGIVLQVWLLGIIPTSTFPRMILHLWPVLLVILGLAILGSALQKSIFSLLGSLVFSATLIFGAWCFGQIAGPIHVDLFGQRSITIEVPPSPDFVWRQEPDFGLRFWHWR
ncbi:MAG: PspC domain-containing protein [Coriobacteriales bacterium]|jgi:phage shock protein C|nr:PspC domain-containing protein [Coriobacteriales bacterium]